MGVFDSFWGLSNRGNQARNQLQGYGDWSRGAGEDYLNRANQMGNRGNYNFGRAADYWGARSAEEAPGIGDVRGAGEQIMPYQGALDRRAQRFQQMLGGYGSGVNQANSVGGRISSMLDEAGGNISRSGDIISNELNQGAQNLIGQSDAGYNDITGNLIRGSGALRNDIGQGYGGISNILSGGYDQAQKTLESIRPGGELQAATAARSFAPARANVMRRLIASGVDPNSPEGVAATSNVGEQQARAMDDALGRNLESYADKSMNLSLGRSGAQAGAAERGLGAQAGVQQDLLNAVPGLQQAGLRTRLGIEQGRQGDVLGNVREQRDLSNQLLGQRGGNEQLTRAMQQQDWGAVNDILGQMNQDELTGVGLGQQQFGAGGNFLDWQQGRRDQPYNVLAGLGQQDIGNMFRGANQAQSFSGDAANEAMQRYMQEQANAGWGSKLLGGIGMGALNMLLPGSGALMGMGGAAQGLGGAIGGGVNRLFGGGGNPGTRAAQAVPFGTPPILRSRDLWPGMPQMGR